MARHLGLPEPVLNTTPTTDTYSLPQGQDEFYFALPYPKMDMLLYAYTHGVDAAEAAKVMDIDISQVEWVYRDIEAKRRTTRYMHLPPLLVEEVGDVGAKLLTDKELAPPT